MNPKIQEQHCRKPAYIYLRQSTPGQVLHHRESTERQYALREKARELGWSESLIRTLDQDLGKTGTEMTRREDFKTLVADVSMGQVGAVFALEVSRLARSNLDWHAAGLAPHYKPRKASYVFPLCRWALATTRKAVLSWIRTKKCGAR